MELKLLLLNIAEFGSKFGAQFSPIFKDSQDQLLKSYETDSNDLYPLGTIPLFHMTSLT